MKRYYVYILHTRFIKNISGFIKDVPFPIALSFNRDLMIQSTKDSSFFPVGRHYK